MLYKLRSSVSNNRVCPEQPTHPKQEAVSWGRQLANNIYSATIQACAIRRSGNSLGISGTTVFGFSTFERLIGDGRFGRPIRCAFPAMELRETPSAAPICKLTSPQTKAFSPSKRSSVQTFGFSVINFLIFTNLDIATSPLIAVWHT